MPSDSLAATPAESAAPAATGSPLVDEQDPLALLAFVAGKPQTSKRLRNPASATALLALVDGYAEHLGDEWSSKPRLEQCHSKKIQELTHINPGLPQQTRKVRELRYARGR
jgi:hypothetical protein